jgi:hypothetical protein
MAPGSPVRLRRPQCRYGDNPAGADDLASCNQEAREAAASSSRAAPTAARCSKRCAAGGLIVRPVFRTLAISVRAAPPQPGTLSPSLAMIRRTELSNPVRRSGQLPVIYSANRNLLTKRHHPSRSKVLRPQCRLSDARADDRAFRRPLPHTRPCSDTICRSARG